MRLCPEKALCSPRSAHQFVGFVDAYLDGEKLTACYLADEEHGYAIVRNPENPTESTALRGRVELRLDDRDITPENILTAWEEMRAEEAKRA